MPSKHELHSAWDRFAIMRALAKRGTNLTRLAISSGLDESACRTAVLRPALGGELAIARCIGMDPATIWPDRYRAPLSGVRSNALEAFRASQKKRDALRPEAAE